MLCQSIDKDTINSHLAEAEGALVSLPVDIQECVHQSVLLVYARVQTPIRAPRIHRKFRLVQQQLRLKEIVFLLEDFQV